MNLRPYTLGCAFTFLLCCVFFNSAWGDCGPPPVKPNTMPVQETSGTTGQTVVYTCDRDTGYYEIPGKSTTITCQADGSWTHSEDFCSRACGVPDRIPFAEPAQSVLNQNFFPPNATVSYSCRPGYKRVPFTKMSLTCLENYTWSIPETFCQRKSCGNPGEVDNGVMEATDFLFGSRVTYTCNVGYRLLNRRNFRDCKSDGTWSNVPPQCDAVICAAPVKPANGEYFPQKDEYTYLDSVTFSCQKPLEVVGLATISCTETGDWSSNPPTCKAVNCPNPDVTNSRRLSGFIGPYTLNSGISFECNKGFVLNGSSSISCNIDSQWVPAVPHCKPVICAAPVKPANGEYFPQKDEYTYLDSVTFSCQKPLEVVGLATISCTETGDWSSNPPTCKVLSCGHPGTIQNGRIWAPNFYVGSKAHYTCKEGFAFPLTSLVNYSICQENGAWSDSDLVCTAICKENPLVPPFALLKETATIYYNGTVVRFECKPGFNSTGKKNTITCRHHSWSDHKEFCTRISCGHPGLIKNGYVSAPDNLFGSRAIYTCEEGYVRSTLQNFTECKEDGKWSPEIACKGAGLSVLVIVGICLGTAACCCCCCCCGVYFINKKKTGKLQPDAPSVRYSNCNA